MAQRSEGRHETEDSQEEIVSSHTCFSFYSWVPLATVTYLFLHKPIGHGSERNPKNTEKINDFNLQKVKSGSEVKCGKAWVCS